jgi:hypothetical protein
MHGSVRRSVRPRLFLSEREIVSRNVAPVTGRAIVIATAIVSANSLNAAPSEIVPTVRRRHATRVDFPGNAIGIALGSRSGTRKREREREREREGGREGAGETGVAARKCLISTRAGRMHTCKRGCADFRHVKQPRGYDSKILSELQSAEDRIHRHFDPSIRSPSKTQS